jgi:hypothetical protein
MVGLGLSDDVIIAKTRAASAGATLHFDFRIPEFGSSAGTG